MTSRDRVGLGWRWELAASILAHLRDIDVVEVLLEDCFDGAAARLNALRTLEANVPVLYHGVSLGLASSHPVDEKRLARVAKTLQRLRAENWSEHLAFVRAGGLEVGHLAAPPRSHATIEGTLNNLRRVQQVVGKAPALENIATLIQPPCSTYEEGVWISQILSHSNTPLLLDLHNLYANALNFGIRPEQLLKSFPLDRIEVIHLSGGIWIQEPVRHHAAISGMRVLDDHVHDVPEDVFLLLEEVAELAPQPLTVIIERDGNYPEFHHLLTQIRRAREAINAGRKKRGLLDERKRGGRDPMQTVRAAKIS